MCVHVQQPIWRIQSSLQDDIEETRHHRPMLLTLLRTLLFLRLLLQTVCRRDIIVTIMSCVTESSLNFQTLAAAETHRVNALILHSAATALGSPTFRVSAPKIWNSPPLHVRQLHLPFMFRCYLKTHYFQ